MRFIILVVFFIFSVEVASAVVSAPKQKIVGLRV